MAIIKWQVLGVLESMLLLGFSALIGSGEAGAHKVSTQGYNQDDLWKASSQLSVCQGHANKGHCSYYSCMDSSLPCGGVVHNTTVGAMLCQAARHQQHTFTAKGLSWARKTNKCLLRRLGFRKTTSEESWCWVAQEVVLSSFVTCAQRNHICDIIWTDRHALLNIFGSGSMLTLIQAGQSCPRHLLHRFMFWMMGQSQHSRLQFEG